MVSQKRQVFPSSSREEQPFHPGRVKPNIPPIPEDKDMPSQPQQRQLGSPPGTSPKAKLVVEDGSIVSTVSQSTRRSLMNPTHKESLPLTSGLLNSSYQDHATFNIWSKHMEVPSVTEDEGRGHVFVLCYTHLDDAIPN